MGGWDASNGLRCVPLGGRRVVDLSPSLWRLKERVFSTFSIFQDTFWRVVSPLRSAALGSSQAGRQVSRLALEEHRNQKFG